MDAPPIPPHDSSPGVEDETATEQPGLSTGGIAKEAVEELAGLERRLPRTLWIVLVRPGFATLEHRNGRGREYVPALRLYALASAIYFATSLATSGRLLNLGLISVGNFGSELPSIAP